mmetsp:Transcript_12166/g.34235  ORF Transcript_12166/g.34235 Transcript_12166/m.34235 type:complete len:226 (+) Transcript_12166:709-1386(+)
MENLLLPLDFALLVGVLQQGEGRLLEADALVPVQLPLHSHLLDALLVVLIRATEGFQDGRATEAGHQRARRPFLDVVLLGRVLKPEAAGLCRAAELLIVKRRVPEHYDVHPLGCQCQSLLVELLNLLPRLLVLADAGRGLHLGALGGCLKKTLVLERPGADGESGIAVLAVFYLASEDRSARGAGSVELPGRLEGWLAVPLCLSCPAFCECLPPLRHAVVGTRCH